LALENLIPSSHFSDQKISEHRIAEGPADERCHHRVSQAGTMVVRQTFGAPRRPDWLAGVGGLELRNVGAKYPFERSHRFPVISRIAAAETIRVRAATVGGAARASCQDLGRMLALAGFAAIFCRDDLAAANPAIPLLPLRWTFPAKRASVVVTDSEPGRLAPLPCQCLSWLSSSPAPQQFAVGPETPSAKKRPLGPGPQEQTDAPRIVRDSSAAHFPLPVLGRLARA
jgi:hypothetical protein